MSTYEADAGYIAYDIDANLLRFADNPVIRNFMGRWGVEKAGLPAPTLQPDTIAAVWYGMRYNCDDETPAITAVANAEDKSFMHDVDWYYGVLGKATIESSQNVALTVIEASNSSATKLDNAIMLVSYLLPKHPPFEYIPNMKNLNRELKRLRKISAPTRRTRSLG